ncbi:MAG: hypothetical protein QY329_15320 [Anaerolineales bacterium]|nr:MAG: hypothetical protein QY329_15320 [Anaerolineales bacterium]
MLCHPAGGLRARADPHPGPLARWGVAYASRHADACPADGDRDGDRHADAEVDAGRFEVNVG